MENQNTVTINLDDYNLLRDFKTKIEKNHSIQVWNAYGSGNEIYTMDDAVKTIAETNKTLIKELNNLRHPDKKQLTVSEIKQMSWWKLYKWKRSNK